MAADVRVGPGALRIEREGFLILGDGRVEVAQAGQGVASQDQCVNTLGVDLDGPVGPSLRILEHPGEEQQAARAHLRGKILRHQVGGIHGILQGIGPVVHLEIGLAEFEEDIPALGIGLRGQPILEGWPSGLRFWPAGHCHGPEGHRHLAGRNPPPSP
jgi:hypothetical protein